MKKITEFCEENLENIVFKIFPLMFMLLAMVVITMFSVWGVIFIIGLIIELVAGLWNGETVCISAIETAYQIAWMV